MRFPGLPAAACHSLENVRFLVECGADIHAKDDTGRAPIYYAAWHYTTKLDVLRYLHQRGAAVDVVDSDGMTMLHRVATNDGSLACAMFLLDKGVDVNAKNNAGETALHRAAEATQKLDMVKLLVERGADVHARNVRQQTPLHKAAMESDDWDKIPFLLENGANAMAVDVHGYTAIHFIIRCDGDLERVEQLLDAGLDIHVRDKAGKSLLHHAVLMRYTYNRQEMVKYLIDAGLDINDQDAAGNTPLHDAATPQTGWADMDDDFRRGRGVDSAETVGELLKLGAAPYIKNNDGKLPIAMKPTVKCKHLLEDAMLQAGVDPAADSP